MDRKEQSSGATVYVAEQLQGDIEKKNNDERTVIRMHRVCARGTVSDCTVCMWIERAAKCYPYVCGQR